VPTEPAAPEEIEITDAMIAAGIQAYCRWDRRVEEIDGLVIAVFEAMLAAYTADSGGGMLGNPPKCT